MRWKDINKFQMDLKNVDSNDGNIVVRNSNPI
jgi:hypothetical protein